VKTAIECQTIDEIRACIDRIDSVIIDQLALRSSYVKAASKFKRTVAEVKASDRVETMMKERRAWAERAGIDPRFIEALFGRIVSFFVKGEIEEWKTGNENSETPQIEAAVMEDAPAILSLQKRAFLTEGEANGNDYNIPPITETIEEMLEDFKTYTILKATLDNRIIGSVRARMTGDVCHIGRVIVEPLYQGRGYGVQLMEAIEAAFPRALEFELFTGAGSAANIRFYTNRGYSFCDNFAGPNGLRLVRMKKRPGRVVREEVLGRS
jgi:chorismate mutase-like protein